MPIVTMQRTFREIGRLRLGQQVEYGKEGKRRPEKLRTWRMTSPQRDVLDAAVAAGYGGEVKPWPEAPDGDAWQLVTTRREIAIVVPPRGQVISQWYEMWGGGGCLRRCNGETEMLTMVPCLCPADPIERMDLAGKGQACKPTTRLSVILPDLPDLGTWMMVSHGFYAASELSGSMEFLAAAASQGRYIPASIAVGWKTIKRPGQPTKDFPVPQIRIQETTGAMMELAGMTAPAAAVRELPSPRGEMPALPAGPALPAVAAPIPTSSAAEIRPVSEPAEEVAPTPTPPAPVAARPAPSRPAPAGKCDAVSPLSGDKCNLMAGHLEITNEGRKAPQLHRALDERGSQRESWPA